MSEPADFAVYRLAQAARRAASRVVLSGEGGDELFAGYPKYTVATDDGGCQPGTRFSPRVGRGTCRPTTPRLRSRVHGSRLRVLVDPDPSDQFRTWFAPFSSRSARPSCGRSVPGPSVSDSGRRSDAIREMLLADLRNWLPDNLLERGDRMSMAASLELRPPLLDHRLAELAFRLASNVKVRSGTTKWV